MQPEDISSTVLRDSDPNLNIDYFKSSLAVAEGIILLYDMTSKNSFERVTDDAYMFTAMCRQPLYAADDLLSVPKQGFACALVGNKLDLVESDSTKRAVDKAMAEQWAHSQGYQHYEISTHSREQIDAVVLKLLVDVIKAKKRDARLMQEVQQTSEKGLDTRGKIKSMFRRQGAAS